MKDMQSQLKLPGVPLAKQGREVAPQWAWTEAVVWTERMLATLERGLGSKELRPLGVPEVENRVVEMAVSNVIEPIFEATFAEHSYGFRPGRGAKDALRRVNELLNRGLVWVVDADLKGYFDSIPQDKLMAGLAERLADGALLRLIEKFLKQGVMETGRGWSPTETGTPQGAVLSPLLANIYLNPLDHLMAQNGWEMVRYADDFVILCESK